MGFWDELTLSEQSELKQSIQELDKGKGAGQRVISKENFLVKVFLSELAESKLLNPIFTGTVELKNL
ncbi:hypothetical protein [Pseudotamlana carrageenivorans]|uniref:hypothetical protein n=1 Tax=Pseudotamlana carrageenivorans TaxID=2069432 RepID=UPI0018F007CF|nr:hypothetical protein [Tamlana carrageenivorans]